MQHWKPPRCCKLFQSYMQNHKAVIVLLHFPGGLGWVPERMRYVVAAGDAGSEGDDNEEGEAARRDIQKDLLMGHLLLSLAQQGAMAPAALPALTASLADRALLPRWVQACALLSCMQ
jgi:hypothetical protein